LEKSLEVRENFLLKRLLSQQGVLNLKINLMKVEKEDQEDEQDQVIWIKELVVKAWDLEDLEDQDKCNKILWPR
jgi:hypothetical protein